MSYTARWQMSGNYASVLSDHADVPRSCRQSSISWSRIAQCRTDDLPYHEGKTYFETIDDSGGKDKIVHDGTADSRIDLRVGWASRSARRSNSEMGKPAATQFGSDRHRYRSGGGGWVVATTSCRANALANSLSGGLAMIVSTARVGADRFGGRQGRGPAPGARATTSCRAAMTGPTGSVAEEGPISRAWGPTGSSSKALQRRAGAILLRYDRRFRAWHRPYRPVPRSTPTSSRSGEQAFDSSPVAPCSTALQASCIAGSGDPVGDDTDGMAPRTLQIALTGPDRSPPATFSGRLITRPRRAAGSPPHPELGESA